MERDDSSCGQVFLRFSAEVDDRLGLFQKEVIEIVYGFGSDILQLLFAPIRQDIVFEQGHVAAVGRGDPLLFTVFFDELIQEFPDREVCHRHMDVVLKLILNGGLSCPCRGVCET